MKKRIWNALLCFVLCLSAVCGASACKEERADGKFTVYAPDGAPALALAALIAETDRAADRGEEPQYEIHIVDSSLIVSYVTGNAPAADFCILPLNAASKQLGNGESYRMIGTVTNGNLYFLTTGEEALTPENFGTALLGKTVGVVQLSNVPGLTLQTVLKDYGLTYRISDNAEETAAEDEVVLRAVEAANVTPASGCDYYLCPEPAASTKVAGTAASANPFRFAGDLQQLYDGLAGYPQAALVAKSGLAESEEGRKAITAVAERVREAEAFLKETEPETLLSLLDGKRTEGLAPSFNANNLTASVIANCSIRFVTAEEDRERVNGFLEKLLGVNAGAAALVSEKFFYVG